MKKFNIPSEDNVTVNENTQYAIRAAIMVPVIVVGAAIIAPFVPIFFVGLMLSIPSTL